jgi:hypothetical protein
MTIYTARNIAVRPMVFPFFAVTPVFQFQLDTMGSDGVALGGVMVPIYMTHVVGTSVTVVLGDLILCTIHIVLGKLSFTS